MKQIFTIITLLVTSLFSIQSNSSPIHMNLKNTLNNKTHKIHSASSIFNEKKEDGKNLCNHEYQSDYNLLIVLLEYNDEKIINSDNDILDVFFDDDNSASSFYKESTYSKINIKKINENNGYIKIKLDKNHPSKRINNEDENSSFLKILELQNDINEAISYIDNNNYINFFDYDKNNNKKIETNELAIHFVVAGYEESYSDNNLHNSIWAHKSNISSKVSNGLYITDYSANSELFYNTNFKVFNELFTIGVVSHELGHSLFCLPDLYSSNDNNAYSGDIGFFDIMGYGTWLSKDKDISGSSPSYFSQWSLSSMNLIKDENISSLNDLIYINYNEKNSYKKIIIDENNYLLLEGRGKNGYDKSLNSLGLIITKVTKKNNGSIDISVWDGLADFFENYYYFPIYENIDYLKINKNSSIENLTINYDNIYFNYISTEDNNDNKEKKSGGSVFYLLGIWILLFRKNKKANKC